MLKSAIAPLILFKTVLKVQEPINDYYNITYIIEL